MVERRWAVIDVETSGLSPRRDRILSVAAVALGPDGELESEYASLFNPGCDPGPVHVHGLTREILHGAPTFESAVEPLSKILRGRTLVAHNAAFDHGFLSVESDRVGIQLPIIRRLCTATLSRRLELDTPNVKLATLAGYWGVPFPRPHDAREDVRAVAVVLQRSLQAAESVGLPLPIVDCSAGSRSYPLAVARSACPWQDPGRFDPKIGLIQGMKVVVTGHTNMNRHVLANKLTTAGLNVMNSASGRTGLVVCNNTAELATRKLRTALERNIPIVTEAALMDLLRSVAPGRPLDFAPTDGAPPAAKAQPPVNELREPTLGQITTEPEPWAGRRILVVGGRHLDATIMRSRITQLGARSAVNLTGAVSDVLILDGGDGDPRMPKVQERGLRVLAPCDIDQALGHIVTPKQQPVAAPAEDAAQPILLRRGQVIDLPSATSTLSINVAWSAGIDEECEIDVMAMELGPDEKVSGDDDLIFYNHPFGPDGATSLVINGDCEQTISTDLRLLAPEVDRVVIGTAIDGEHTFADVGALSVTIDTSERTIATTVLDAATTERSMIAVEIYRRSGTWRLRSVGQGYDDGLAEFITRYGVEVD